MTRELDALVAEKVMGVELHVHEPSENGQKCKYCGLNKSYVEFGTKLGRIAPPAHYSTSIADAWLVVEKIGGDFYYSRFSEGDHQAQFDCIDAQAPTAPEAICLAALKAIQPSNRSRTLPPPP